MSALAIEPKVVWLPLGPLMDWIEEIAGAEPWERARRRVVRETHISGATLDRWRAKLADDPAATVSERDIDAHLVKTGRRTLMDIWPESSSTRWKPTDRARARTEKSEECASPGCHDAHNGGLFCHEHGERLARIRKEYLKESELMAGGVLRKVALARDDACVRVGCFEPRAYGELLCEGCQGFCGEES